MATIRWGADTYQRRLKPGQSCSGIPWGRADEFIACQPDPRLLTRIAPRGPLGTGDTIKCWPSRQALEHAVWKHGQTCRLGDPVLRPVAR